MDLTELTDRVLIAHTLAVYCDYVDRFDLPALLGLFTDDVLLDMGRGVLITGQEHLCAALIQRVGRWTSTSHHNANVIVTAYSGTHATVLSYVYAFHNNPERDEAMHLWGRYEDELVKVDGAWRIRIRRLRVAGAQETVSSAFPARFEGVTRALLPAR